MKTSPRLALVLLVVALGVSGVLVFAFVRRSEPKAAAVMNLASASGASFAAASSATSLTSTLNEFTPAATTASLAPELLAPKDVSTPPRDAVRSRSGVFSRLLRAGTGKDHPEPNDRISVHYTTWKRDGALMDSSRLRGGAPYHEALRGLYPGLVETMQAMVVGESRRIWIPARLTFERDAEDTFVRVDLTVDVELLAIQKAPRPPRSLRAPPTTATRLPSGLAYEILERSGAGADLPAPTSRVTFYHSGWSSDGVLFESTELAGEPQTAELPTLLPGLREGLRVMHVGDRARFWVPERLGYGSKPRRRAPAGPLTFDVRLLKME